MLWSLPKPYRLTADDPDEPPPPAPPKPQPKPEVKVQAKAKPKAEPKPKPKPDPKPAAQIAEAKAKIRAEGLAAKAAESLCSCGKPRMPRRSLCKDCRKAMIRTAALHAMRIKGSNGSKASQTVPIEESSPMPVRSANGARPLADSNLGKFRSVFESEANPNKAALLKPPKHEGEASQADFARQAEESRRKAREERGQRSQGA